MEHIIIGIGSNVGNKLHNIKLAITQLTKENIVTNIKISNIYESKALLPENAPDDWDINFYNLAISGLTNYEPANLLKLIKNIEQEVGRVNRGIWSPREIDLDILAYGNKIIQTEQLSIPHKSFLERPFTLLPASEILPNWQYPIKGNFYKKTLKEIVNSGNINHNICWKVKISIKL